MTSTLRDHLERIRAARHADHPRPQPARVGPRLRFNDLFSDTNRSPTVTIARVTCDRCGREVTADRTLLHTQCGPLRLFHPAIDLCLDCGGDLAAWLNSGSTREPADERETAAPALMK